MKDAKRCSVLVAFSLFMGLPCTRGEYFLSDLKLSWNDSRDACEFQSGYLVKFDDESEYTSILEEFGARFSGSEDIWIGANDLEIEGTFQWLDGTPLELNSHWLQGQPNDWNGQDCVQLDCRSDYGACFWDDMFCVDEAAKFSYMCECEVCDVKSDEEVEEFLTQGHVEDTICVQQKGISYPNNTLEKLENVSTSQDCCNACEQHEFCKIWVFIEHSQICFLKFKAGVPSYEQPNVISGFNPFENPFELCGNGDPERPEVCDDGNDDMADACSNACTWNFCGDGVVQEVLGEECDDGNFDMSDGCNNCQKTCGDGILDSNEVCDPGREITGGSQCTDTCVERDDADQGEFTDQCQGTRKKRNPGYCGCLEEDIDTDGDGTPDCDDECPYNPETTAEPCTYDCGDCLTPNFESGGCSHAPTVNCVNRTDDFCVFEQWDMSCVLKARHKCGCR